VNQQSGPELARMLLFVAAVVATVILVFFAIGYGLGRLLL
jgi:preprotein translocase subunit SecE